MSDFQPRITKHAKNKIGLIIRTKKIYGKYSEIMLMMELADKEGAPG